MRRYIVLVASLAIQICLGGVYAWSEFVPPLTADYGLSTTQTQVVFGTTIAVFTLVMIAGGHLLGRWGPRVVAAIGGVLFGLGYVIAYASGASFLGLLLGIGVVAGAGIGFGYVCPLTTCMKWFPERKGLVTGITVAGFGAGAIVVANVTGSLLDADWSVPAILLMVGLVGGSTVLVMSTLLALPASSGAGNPTTRMPVATLVRQRIFWALAAGMFAGTFAGLLAIGNLKPIGLAEGVGANAATLAISAFAVGNASGRIIWGAIYDRWGGVSMPASLLLLGVAVLALTVTAGAVPFVLFSTLTGFCFGACFVVYASRVATLYGIQSVGTVYPLVFLAYGISGITGPVVGGWAFDSTGSYASATYLAALIAATGAATVALIGRRRPVAVLDASD